MEIILQYDDNDGTAADDGKLIMAAYMMVIDIYMDKYYMVLVGSNIFRQLYLLLVPIRTAALQILSNGIGDDMQGIKLRKRNIWDLDKLMKIGVILNIIEVSQCNSNIKKNEKWNICIDCL